VPRPDAPAAASSCPPRDSADALALKAADDIDNIHEVQRAFVCVENLVAPHRVNDSEEVGATRSELSSLLQLLNECWRRPETEPVL
jgi:hypothetical protein